MPRLDGTDQPLLPSPDIVETNEKAAKRLRLLLGGSFFLFGLMNNVLYVIILSAALDLVPPSTPKGIIAFCNIAPALVAKVGWPYVLKGKIRYTRRLLSCCALSVSGMLIVAMFETLPARLLGISFASFASGLGELTFLQLSTTYHPKSVAGHCVGYFASGTGAAGLAGAGLWWELRGLGVRLGVGLSAILPFSIPLTYHLILPPPDDYTSVVGSGVDCHNPTSEYTALPDDETETDDVRAVGVAATMAPIHGLTLADKWRLVRPLLLKYMLPLFCVYTFEYTINQGISPTLVYPVPTVKNHPVLSSIVRSTRDYYPLWQLIYQAFVFLSRSSISLGLPALPAALLPVPSVIQGCIMTFLAIESATGFLSAGQPESTTQGSVLPILMSLIAVEGVCGGLAYVNVFYRVGQESAGVFDRDDMMSREIARQEQEFRIGSIGFADSSGILLASLIAMPTEVGLCHAQVQRELTMRFIPASDPNKATYGISTGLKYACHVPMACGTTSYFAKNACDLPSRNAEGYSERGRNAVEIVTLEDLGDTSSCRSGIAGLLQARLRHRELGGWHSTPNLANSLQSASEGSHPSPRSQSPCFNSTRRQAGGPQGSEFRSTALRQCWTASKARQISITHLEWYEFRDGTNQFMLCLLNFPPAMHKKPNWLRLERRSKRHGLGSVAERAKILVGEHSANDIAIFSTNRGDLLDGENDKFTLKEAVDKPIPFSFMLDVLDLAHKNLASSENDSWLYVSFVMSAIHQFCEPARLSSDNRASIQSNNPHYIIKTLADRRHSSDLEHEITLQHDWEVLDLGDINEPYNDTAHEGVPIPEYRFLAAA